MGSTNRLGRMIAALMLVALTACSGDDSGSLPDDDETTETTTSASVATIDAPQLERRAARVAVPVLFTSGDVVFEVTKVEFSNATPGTYLDDEPELITDELLYVTFTARVDPSLGAAAASHEWAAMHFKIATADGRVIAASGVDFADFVEVTPEQPTTTAVVFPADDDDLVGARLVLDDGANSPAEVMFVAA